MSFLLFKTFVFLCILQISVSIKYIGCYKEKSITQRLFNKEKKNFEGTLTPTLCSDHCRDLGWPYAGLQYRIECFCSDVMPSIEQKADESDCNESCDGDEKQICGGGLRLSVYHTEAKLLGCYNEISVMTRLLPLRRKDFPGTLTPTICVNHCSSRGLNYAGLQYGKECFCSNEKPSPDRIVDSSQCRTKCEGDETKFCGGELKISVYESEAGSTLLGCYNDKEGNLMTNSAFKWTNAMTPSNCIDHCREQEMAYAGIKDGNNCFCSAMNPLLTAKVEDEECNTTCATDPSQFCGAENKITVHKIKGLYRGCFKDISLTERVMPLAQTNMDGLLTPLKCMEHCRKQGALYSGMQYRKECFCSTNMPDKSYTSESNNCKYECDGDHTQTCGGDFILSVYELEGEEKEIGCFISPNAVTLAEQKERQIPGMVPKVCVDYCRTNGHYYAGLKSGEWCYCFKKTLPSSSKVDLEQCDSSCQGDPFKKCGSEQMISLYKASGLAEYKGCFKDVSLTQRLMPKFRKDFPGGLTPAVCSDHCRRNGLQFSGGQYGKECFCSEKLPPTSSVVDENECSISCEGDSYLYCGGNWRLSVYASEQTYGTKYLGCYKDISITVRLMPHHRKDFPGTLRPDVCVEHCLNNGMTYAGLQYGRECFCSEERPQFTSLASDSDCNMRCEGDFSQTCGGSFRLSVYDILGQAGNHEVSRKVGCFEDFREDRLLPKKMWASVKQLTPEICLGHCWRHGYRFAGVQAGRECHCGDSVRDRAVIGNFHCDTPCTGDRTIKCGGTLKMDVYDTGIPDYSDEDNLIGCFNDDQEVKLLSGGKYDLTESNTPRKCMNLCYSLGYRFSGVQYRIECFCGNKKPPNNREVGENECQSRCPGDKNEYCGGNYRILVYKTGKGSTEHRPTSTAPPYSMTTHRTSITPVHRRPTVSSQPSVPVRPKPPALSRPPTSPTSEPSVNILSSPNNCKLSVSTVNGKSVCQRSIIFSDDFNSNFNREKWFHNVFMPKGPDFEFVVFTKRTTNSFVKDGRLHIRPTLLEDDTVRTGKLNLPDCTGELHTDECERQAVAFNFLPPIESARISTEESVSFKYGRVDITAKLPSGDWIVPELWLEPKRNVYGVGYASGRIRIAAVRGNPDLTLGNRQLGARVLEGGVLLGQGDTVRGRSVFRNSTTLWTNDFHTFTLVWAPNNITFMVDGSERQGLLPASGGKLLNLVGFQEDPDWISGSNSPVAPFDKEFFLSIGLSVGGMRNFPDGCISAGHSKPWKNLGVKALSNFYQAKNSWYGTWNDEDSTLIIDSIKITAL